MFVTFLINQVITTKVIDMKCYSCPVMILVIVAVVVTTDDLHFIDSRTETFPQDDNGSNRF